MNIVYFVFVMFKRFLKKPAFLSALVVVPIVCLFLKGAGFGGELKIKAGIYSESEISRKIFEDYERAVDFIYYDDAESLKRDVSGRKLECGYYFTENLTAEYDKDSLKNSIICYKSPATSFDKVVNEVIFSELFKDYALDILKDFSAERGAASLEAFEGAYNLYLGADRVITLNYNYIEETHAKGGGVNPFSYLKGLMGIFIMLGGIWGGFLLGADLKAGLWKTLTPVKKSLAAYVYFAVPALLCGVSAGAGLMLSGAYAPSELWCVLGYCMLASVYGAFVYALFGKGGLGAASAVILVGSLIFCPVFVSLGGIFPFAEVLAKAFIPTYYIEGGILGAFAAFSVLSFIGLQV